MVVSISTQGSMKYEIYRSIEHNNVIEQQMPDLHVHDQIYMYGHIHINLFTNHYQKVGFSSWPYNSVEDRFYNLRYTVKICP